MKTSSSRSSIYEQSWLLPTMTPPVNSAVLTGQGPFGRGKVWSYLHDFDIAASAPGDNLSPDVLIIGRENYDEQGIKRLVEARRGKTLRICSQEMMLGWVLTGEDPNRDIELVRKLIDDHSGLQLVRELLEGAWPTTGVIPSTSNGSQEFDKPEKGPLKRMGYKVGRSGHPAYRRRKALSKAFETPRQQFPGRYPSGYLGDWGRPRSSQRLSKIARSIAGFCTTAQSRSNPPHAAIEDWKEDLAWLKKEYYNALTYSFRWPYV